jgi:hypothetical protein
VFVRQGHYASDAGLLATQPAADLAIDSIGDLVDRADLLTSD